MRKITPFLWFNDQADEAARFCVAISKEPKVLSISRNGEGPRR
jgi:predicted 3-demethylubiquinone-9 3-methyltransferase (glyoxalase superfamily)